MVNWINKKKDEKKPTQTNKYTKINSEKKRNKSNINQNRYRYLKNGVGGQFGLLMCWFWKKERKKNCVLWFVGWHFGISWMWKVENVQGAVNRWDCVCVCVLIKLPGWIFANAHCSTVTTLTAMTIIADATARLLQTAFCCLCLCHCQFIGWTLYRCGRWKIAARLWFYMTIIHFHIHNFHELNLSGQFLNFLLQRKNRKSFS